MRSINKVVTYIFILMAAFLTFVCFFFALLFIIAGINAPTQVSFNEFIVLLSFCIIFSIAGCRFLTIANLLFDKARR